MQLWRYEIPIERLGAQYRLIRPLGNGGMADVCLAFDEKNKIEVAIKVLRFELLDKDLLSRFIKEASLVAGWKHPNIIRIYDEVQWEVLDPKRGSLLPYIVMEYVTGGNLKERIVRGQPGSFSEALHLFSQICSAVQYAHEHNVIHRDIKPENILFRQHKDGSEDVLLSDFGMAVSLFATHHTFSHGGTPAYMAPEQIQGQAQPASDIYALGVLLYQLCTGRLPFQFAQIARRVQPPARVSTINPALPTALDEIILSALAEDPAQRLPSALIFSQRLQNIAISNSSTSSTPGSVAKPALKQATQQSLPEKSKPIANSSMSGSVVLPIAPPAQKKKIDAVNESKRANADVSAPYESRPGQLNEGKGAHTSGTANTPSVSSEPAMISNNPSREDASFPLGYEVNPNSNLIDPVVLKNIPTAPVSSNIEATELVQRSEDNSAPEIIELGPVRALRPTEFTSARLSSSAIRKRNGDVVGAVAANANSAGSNTAATDAMRSSGGSEPPQKLVLPNRNRRNEGTGLSLLRVLQILALLLLLTTLIAGVAYASVNPVGFQTAIVRPLSNLMSPGLHSNQDLINIVPDSKEVQDSYVMQAVTNQPNAAQLQVGIRNLAATPDAQTKTVAGIGHTQTPASTASGLLTFTNGSTTPYTISSATAIPGPNGVSVIPDTSVTVPAADPNNSAPGRVSVRGHAVVAGSRGNLTAGVISGQCCAAGNFITVVNGAFSGGVDPQDYTFVQQGDVNAAATPLESTLAQQASVQFKQQVKGNERVVGDPVCNSDVQVDPTTVGDKGRNIAETTITVTAKCTGVAYDQAGVQAIAKDRLQKKANSDPGQGYALVGTIVTDVSISKVNTDSIPLLVNARGIWVYQWDDAQKQALVRQVAGKKVSDAQALLNAQHGINNAKIEAKGDTLPTDPNQIMLNVQKVPGENVNSNNGGGNSANPNGAPASESGKGDIPRMIALE